MRLAYLLELMLGLAVGQAIAIYQFHTRHDTFAYRTFSVPGTVPIRVWVDVVGSGTLLGVALVEGVFLAVESQRRRDRAPWGIGRLTWCLAGIFFVCQYSGGIFLTIVPFLRKGWYDTTTLPIVTVQARDFWGISAAIVALWLTAWLARFPRDPKPDVREWTGRLYAVLVLSVWGASQMPWR